MTFRIIHSEYMYVHYITIIKLLRRWKWIINILFPFTSEFNDIRRNPKYDIDILESRFSQAIRIFAYFDELSFYRSLGVDHYVEQILIIRSTGDSNGVDNFVMQLLSNVNNAKQINDLSLVLSDTSAWEDEHLTLCENGLELIYHIPNAFKNKKVVQLAKIIFHNLNTGFIEPRSIQMAACYYDLIARSLGVETANKTNYWNFTAHEAAELFERRYEIPSFPFEMSDGEKMK